MCSSRRSLNRQGAALVTVLWLTAALATIAFSLARSIREETQRTENLVESVKASLLARGGIERTFFFLTYPPPTPRLGETPIFEIGQQRILHRFPGGDVQVDILPESGKLGVNIAKPEQILAVLVAAGMDPTRATNVTQAIVQWRTPLDGQPSFFTPTSTFWIRHASFEQIEELLMVPGVTSEWFYGHRAVLPGGGTVARPGLRDLLSVYGSAGPFDINSAPPAVMLAAGVPAMAVDQIVQRRKLSPITPRELGEMNFAGGPANQILRAGFDTAYTFRATAWPRRPDGKLSDFRRTVAALIAYEITQPPVTRPVLKQWYEVAPAPEGSR